MNRIFWNWTWIWIWSTHMYNNVKNNPLFSISCSSWCNIHRSLSHFPHRFSKQLFPSCPPSLLICKHFPSQSPSVPSWYKSFSPSSLLSLWIQLVISLLFSFWNLTLCLTSHLFVLLSTSHFLFANLFLLILSWMSSFHHQVSLSCFRPDDLPSIFVPVSFITFVIVDESSGCSS